jgi:DNA polymerase III alpha subunit (gram-positive type)
MRFVVFDTETDGLLDTLTKAHVLGYTEDGENITTTHDYKEMVEFFSQEDVMFVGHNSVRYDMPAMNKVLGLNLNYTRFVDTLALSWYLEFPQSTHGLEAWGERLGVKKPKIDDWENLTAEEYAHRVREDVKINWLLWKRLESKLGILYGWKTKSP